jgi:hypothetical protein
MLLVSFGVFEGLGHWFPGATGFFGPLLYGYISVPFNKKEKRFMIASSDCITKRIKIGKY